MDLTVIARIAKARWLILVGAGLLAIFVTGRLAEYQNENLVTHESAAVVKFAEDPAALDRADFEAFLTDQHLLARNVNSDVVGSTPGAFLPWRIGEVNLQLDQNQISFVGRGYNQEEADELVDTMQSRYLAISSVGAGYERLTQELDDLVAEIASLEGQIAVREAQVTADEAPGPLTEEQVQAETRRAVLASSLVALADEYGRLQVELISPIDRTTAQIQADIERVQNEMLTFQTELNAIPSVPAAVPVLDEQLVVDRLTLENVRLRYQTVHAQRAGVEGLASGGPVTARAVTAVAGSPFTNQTLAFVAAMVATLMVLVGIERTRGIIWAEKEVDSGVSTLTELPPRGFATLRRPTDQPWYLTVPGGRRKSSVQLIRSQLDNYHNVVVAFQGSGVFDDDTLDLTADVAMSAAVSGRTVLLIDATFSGRNRLVEYESGDGATLTSLLIEGSTDPEAEMTVIKEALLDQVEIHRDLRVLRSGSVDVDAGDTLAGQRFEMLLDVARDAFDLVLIAGSSFGEPTSYIMAQRVDQAILVGSIGHSTGEDVSAAERDFRSRSANLAGIVMIRRRRSRLGRLVAPKARRTLWKAIDTLEPMTERVKDFFGSGDSADDDQPGISGFSGRFNELESADRDRYLNDNEEANL